MTPVAQILRQVVLERGPMSFAQFMETALYCPKIGYYERSGGVVGTQGDFFTSVSAAPLFAELLAFQCAEWLTDIAAERVMLVEAGAHDAALAKGILSWLKLRRPELLGRLEYWFVEPSEARRAWQKANVDEFAGQVRWVGNVQSLPPVNGVILSNELVDAMPVHRLAWAAEAREWIELGVGIQGEGFQWVPLSQPTIDIPAELKLAGFEIPLELAQVLPNGFVLEVSPAAREWWSRAATRLERGRLLTVDYGLEAEQLLAPQRAEGTLRSYKDHRLVPDVLNNPGEQDITAHINFSQLRLAGESFGLRTEPLLSQERFLGQIVRQSMSEGANFGEWNSKRVQQLQILTHPEHLGRPFQVLVQSRPQILNSV
jgi:SAM-dependent MidA family methyltransferase